MAWCYVVILLVTYISRAEAGMQDSTKIIGKLSEHMCFEYGNKNCYRQVVLDTFFKKFDAIWMSHGKKTN